MRSCFAIIYVTDNELNQQFESIENTSAPVSLYTIEKGSQLAKKYVEQATEAKMLCDKINTDQLLQQQGSYLRVFFWRNIDVIEGKTGFELGKSW